MNVPSAAQFADPAETIVYLTGERDDFCRQRFTAFWLDEQTPGGVRGQVFYAVVDEFAARSRGSVRVYCAGPYAPPMPWPFEGAYCRRCGEPVWEVGGGSAQRQIEHRRAER